MNPGFEQAFEMCAPWSYGLMALTSVTVALILERTIVLFFSYNLHVPAFIELLDRLWKDDKLDRAEKLALALPKRSPFAQLARVGLAHPPSHRTRRGPPPAASKAAGGAVSAGALTPSPP